MERFAYEMVRPFLKLPHPAYRVLSNELYVTAGQILQFGFTGVIELTQKRGFVFKCCRDYLANTKERLE